MNIPPISTLQDHAQSHQSHQAHQAHQTHPSHQSVIHSYSHSDSQPEEPSHHHHPHAHSNTDPLPSPSASVPPGPWGDVVSEVLITAGDLNARIAQLGLEMTHVYGGSNPLLLVVLKGSFLFAADLSRALPFEHQVEFIRAKSYQGSATTGIVQLQGLESVDLTNRHVIIIEDIVDTGLTLRRLYDALQHAGAASVKCCTLLEKITPRRHHSCPKPDFVAFRIPDKFVVGYGLDYDQRFRHLPFVGVINTQILGCNQ